MVRFSSVAAAAAAADGLSSARFFFFFPAELLSGVPALAPPMKSGYADVDVCADPVLDGPGASDMDILNGALEVGSGGGSLLPCPAARKGLNCMKSGSLAGGIGRVFGGGLG